MQLCDSLPFLLLPLTAKLFEITVYPCHPHLAVILLHFSLDPTARPHDIHLCEKSSDAPSSLLTWPVGRLEATSLLLVLLSLFDSSRFSSYSCSHSFLVFFQWPSSPFSSQTLDSFMANSFPRLIASGLIQVHALNSIHSWASLQTPGLRYPVAPSPLH